MEESTGHGRRQHALHRGARATTGRWRRVWPVGLQLGCSRLASVSCAGPPNHRHPVGHSCSVCMAIGCLHALFVPYAIASCSGRPRSAARRGGPVRSMRHPARSRHTADSSPSIPSVPCRVLSRYRYGVRLSDRRVAGKVKTTAVVQREVRVGSSLAQALGPRCQWLHQQWPARHCSSV